jgi:hypothetical protein
MLRLPPTSASNNASVAARHANERDTTSHYTVYALIRLNMLIFGFVVFHPLDVTAACFLRTRGSAQDE